jgi:O-antigen ligase
MNHISWIKRAERIALYLFFFSINFEVWDPFNTGGFFSVSKLAGLIYFITLIPHINYFVNISRIKSYLVPLLLFVTLLTFVSVYNIPLSSAWVFYFTIFQNLLLFVLLANHERRDPLILQKAMLSFACGSVAISLLFIAGIGVLDVFGRFTIFGDNATIVGLKMSISIIILVIAVAQDRLKLGKLRYSFLLFVPIMMHVLAATGSRVACISLTLSLGMGLIIFKWKSNWRRVIAVSLVVALSFFIVRQLASDSGILSQRLMSSAREGDLSERDIIWRELLPMIQDNPIFGVGVTGYAYYSKRIFGCVESPHNVLIEVACLTGICGLIMYLMFLYQVLKQACRLYYRDGLLLPLLLLIPLSGMLVSAQLLEVKIGWCMFAFIAANVIVHREEREEHEDKIRWAVEQSDRVRNPSSS